MKHQIDLSLKDQFGASYCEASDAFDAFVIALSQMPL